MANARATVYALNNSALGDYIDHLKEVEELTDTAAKATEKLTQSLIEQLKIEDAVNLMEDEERLKNYVNTIGSINSTYKNSKGEIVTQNAAAILGSDDYTIPERVEAYKKLEESILALGDPKIEEAFYSINRE